MLTLLLTECLAGLIANLPLNNMYSHSPNIFLMRNRVLMYIEILDGEISVWFVLTVVPGM
jgi:hypothetical protein